MVIDESMTNCNANVISIKVSFAIDMNEFKDYEKIELQEYQWLISKLIYLIYSIRLNIASAIV